MSFELESAYFNNKPVKQVVGSGPSSSYCRDTLYVFGDNSYNQIRNTSNISTINALSIAAYDHTVVVLANGNVAAWGKNDFGQCNIPPTLNNVKRVAAGENFTVALKNDGTVVAWGDNTSGQCNVPVGLNSVLAIAAGDNHAIAFKSDRSIVAWGANFFGQISIPTNIGTISNIAAGGDNSAVLLTNGNVYIWGSNLNGNLNVPANLTDVSSLSIKKSHVLALRNNGTVVAWGSNNFGQITLPSSLNGIKCRKVSAGLNYSLALKNDGGVIFWGDNSKGQLNPFPTLYQVDDITSGHSHNIAIYCSVIPTPTPTITPTSTQVTPTPTRTPTATPTLTPTLTETPRATNTPRSTVIVTSHPTRTPTKTPVTTPSVTPSRTQKPSRFRDAVIPPKFNQFIPPKPTQEVINFVNPSPTPTRTQAKTPTPTPTITPTLTKTLPPPSRTPTTTRTPNRVSPTPSASAGSSKNCAYPAFNGFLDVNNTYTTITLYKWDSCISTGNPNDGIRDYSKFFQSPSWNVDGHVTLLATTKTTGIVRESTGVYFSSRYPVGSTQLISRVINFNDYTVVASENVKHSGLSNFNCNNPDGSMNFIHLTNEYSKNCVPFGVNGPVYGVYHDSIDNKIYAVGSFSTVNSLERRQVAKFNYNGIYDPSFDVSQGYYDDPFDYPPNDIRRINGSFYISALQKFGTVGSNVLTFRSQNVAASHLHKVDSFGVKDPSFIPFTFNFNNNFIDYVSVSSQNLLVMVNSRAISFRSSLNNLQISSPINGTDTIQGIVKPNEPDPSNVYILQKINGGIDSANKPKAIKAIDTLNRKLNPNINNFIGEGLVSTDLYGGYTLGSMSTNRDFMVLQRLYGDNNMTAGYWNNGSVDSPVLSKISTSNFSITNNTVFWNTFNHRIDANASNGNMLIDSNGRIYMVLLNNFTNYVFSNVTIKPYSIIRLFSDGTLDQTFNVMGNLNPNAKIYNACLISDFELIICGDFTSYAGNASRQYITKIDNNARPVNVG
jgi:hypothetical protein